MDPLSAFATALTFDNTCYINDDGTMMREYWASDGAVNHIGTIYDFVNDEEVVMDYEDLEDFVADKHNQEQAMDLAIQMMIQTYYSFVKVNGRGLIN